MVTRAFLTVILAALAVAPAMGWAAEVGTAFTYQGVLADGGTPANGAHDFRFALFDADYGGTQVGSTLFVEDAGVSEGHLTLQLDFGPVFNGTAVWLEVSVRDGSSTGAYTVLTPRQELSATPYARYAVEAQHATSADTATSAGDAAQLGGEDPGYYLEWSNINVPPDISDGDDDVLGGLTCGAGEVARWSGTAWNCASAAEAYLRTYVVGPTGTPTENGAALLAALAAIPVPASQEEAALLKIEPGLYDLGVNPLNMKSWVDVEGSGREVTKITADACSAVTIGVVSGASDSELRDLSVENTCVGPSETAIGIRIEESHTRIRRVAVRLEGAVQNNEGISILSDFAVLTDVEVVVVNATDNSCGIYITGNSNLLDHVSARAYGDGAGTTYGIRNNGGAALVLGDVGATAEYGMTISAFVSNGPFIYLKRVFARVAYGTNMVAIVVVDPYILDLRSVETMAVGGTAISIDEYSFGGSTVRLQDVDMTGTPEYGLRVNTDQNDVEVTVDRCLIRGSTSTLYNNGGASAFRVGSSRLAGGPPSGPGAITCAGVYDENYTFYPNSCP
ncbi:MAG: hypothetical protein ABFS37_06415 [Acidobacteriota bacterium]